MKRGLLCAAIVALAAFRGYSDGHQASITSTPSPIVSTKAFEVIIQTSDLGSEVYCYTWAVVGGKDKGASDWGGAINAKFRMTGTGGTYKYKVADLKALYNLTDDEMTQVTKLGFIARNNSQQTADCFVDVVQGRREAYSGGEGTAESPFIIKTAADLNELASTSADWASDVYVRLDADITLTGSFPGIASKGSPYKGHFNGNSHVVKGASVNGTSFGMPTGFFNAIDGAEISGLGLTDLSVSGTTFTGGLVGYAYSGTVSRCFTAGNVSATSICVGGLVGENHAAISDCYSIAAVTTADDNVAGGLVGKNKGSVKNTYASGEVKASNYAGGLVGANYGTVVSSTSFNPAVTAGNGNYAGRFGGNNNARNTVDRTLAWELMPMADSATHGHHAIGHNQNLVNKNVYSDVLGWDFNNVWEWRQEGTHEYPVLAGIPGQVDPGNDLFYGTLTGIDIIDTESANVSVYPNPVVNVLNITGAKSMERVMLYGLDGAKVRDIAVNGASDAAIDCSGLHSGMYVLCLYMTDGSKTVVKVIKI